MSSVVMGGRARRLVQMIGWTTIAQVLSALSNFVFTLAVVRGGGADALGSFAIGFGAYLVLLNVARALVSEPLLTARQAEGDLLSRGSALTLTILLSLTALPVVAAIGLLLGRAELVAIAAVLPVVLVHDLLRYQMFQAGRPAVAALLDGGWLLGSLLAWPLVTGSGSPVLALLCWAGAAACGVVLAAPVVRIRAARIRASVTWWRCTARTFAPGLLVENLTVAASTQLLVFVVVYYEGESALGVLRAAQVYFMPIGLVIVAIQVLLVTRLARRPELLTRSVAAKVGLALTASALLAAAAVVVSAPTLQTALYADALTIPPLILIPIALQFVLAGAPSGMIAVTKARRRGVELAQPRVASGLIGMVLLVWWTSAFGIVGATCALAAQAFVYAVFFTLVFLRNNRSETV